MTAATRGRVVAAHQAGADAGARVLSEGGNAVDAAIATAAALAVADPANCGIGGYGGFMVVHRPPEVAARQVDFNTAPPAAFDPPSLAHAPRTGPFVHGGVSVSVPAVVPGLLAAHAAFGRLPFADLLAPAIALAADGCRIGPDLARSLAWAARNHGGLSDAFKEVFFHGGQPLQAGDLLVQPELAASLEAIGARADRAWRSGPLVDAMCRCVRSEGGTLAAGDFAAARTCVAEAERTPVRDAVVYGPERTGSGYGVLASALSRLDEAALGENRGQRYIAGVAAALRAAWDQRRAAWSLLIAESQHTSHFCTVDADGMLVSCTFTQGPLWFGSGLAAPGTGIVLNCGANLYARRRADGALAGITNLAPAILVCGNGARHAIGSPGGIRIPAVVLQAVLDVVHYGIALDEALPLPRVSVDYSGRLEVEPALAATAPDARTIRVADYYGPASGIAVPPAGVPVAAQDPRFDSAVA